MVLWLPQILLVDDSTAMLTLPDRESFAEGIIKLINDTELRNRIANAGYELYRSKYNFQEFSKMIGECYSTVVRKPVGEVKEGE